MNFCPGSKNSIIGKTTRYDRIINELCHFYKVSYILVVRSIHEGNKRTCRKKYSQTYIQQSIFKSAYIMVTWR
jgi:hypothetical protein